MKLTDIMKGAGPEWEEKGYQLPKFDIEAVRAKTHDEPTWVHFGAGNIFRAFPAAILNEALNSGKYDRGVIVAESFDYEIIDKAYQPYDNLSLLVSLKSTGTIEKKVIASVTESLKADYQFADWARLQEIFRNPSLQMISFTITEKGYGVAPADLERGLTPVLAMGKVAVLLYERFQAGKLPLTVQSMDNCSHNGDKVKAGVLKYAEKWVADGLVPAEFKEYLLDETRITFPWSMIDKITPRPAESVVKELEALGIEDMAPVITSKHTYIAPFVNAEGPQYLVIEDKFPNGRPKLEDAGVYMTDRDTVNKVERMKVTTCLNPLHTALAVYGCVLGYTLIADEMKDTELNKLVHEIGPVEGMPVVTNPGILSPEAFVDEVINVRIPNPFMPDTPQRIATDTSQKVGIRYGETIKSYVAKYGDAKKLKAIPLAIAGWLRYLLGVDDEGQAFERSADPMLETLSQQMEGITLGHPESVGDKVRPILSNVNIFGSDLYEAGIGDLIEDLFKEELAGPGAVRATLKKYLD